MLNTSMSSDAKRKKIYICSKCRQPKRGHICTATDASPNGSSLHFSTTSASTLNSSFKDANHVINSSLDSSMNLSQISQASYHQPFNLSQSHSMPQGTQGQQDSFKFQQEYLIGEADNRQVQQQNQVLYSQYEPTGISSTIDESTDKMQDFFSEGRSKMPFGANATLQSNPNMNGSKHNASKYNERNAFRGGMNYTNHTYTPNGSTLDLSISILEDKKSYTKSSNRKKMTTEDLIEFAKPTHIVTLKIPSKFVIPLHCTTREIPVETVPPPYFLLPHFSPRITIHSEDELYFSIEQIGSGNKKGWRLKGEEFLDHFCLGYDESSKVEIKPESGKMFTLLSFQVDGNDLPGCPYISNSSSKA